MNSFWGLKSLSSRRAPRHRRRPIRHAARLLVELLEDRRLLSGMPAGETGYGNLPLAFEANQGQTAAQVDFLARGSGYMLSLNPSEAVLRLQNSTGGDELHLQFVGANPLAQVVGRDELITKTNYLMGSDPTQWQTGIPNYGKVEYQDVYPGINLLYYGNQGQLEYDFVVDPGIDPGIIAISVQGAQAVTLDAQGNLVLHMTGGVVVQQAPVLYQEVGGVRQAVAGEFVLEGNTEVGFRIGTYDMNLPLVIDPILSYSTYLGGSSDDAGNAIAVDAVGNAYVTGYTYSANFPTTGGVLQGATGGKQDAFVAKLNASGTAIIYSTYLGGNWGEAGKSIAVDAAGNAYVTGYTESSNFPVSAGAFDQTNRASWTKGFVTKLNSTGSALLYSTYLGGSSGFDGGGRAITVDADGNAYVTGSTFSSDFPTVNAVQPVHADDVGGGGYDAFVTKLNAAGTALVYSTYLGGTGNDDGKGIAVDSAGNAYVTGYTTGHLGPILFPTTTGAFQQTNASTSSVPFVTKLNAAGSALAYSTFLGGTNGFDDWAAGIAVDAAGNAYITGTTQAADFPTTVGAFDRTYGGGADAFVSALNPSGSALVYSTYLGGSNVDQPLGIAVDAAGNAYVVGGTDSSNFPTINAVQPALGGSYDAFVTKLNVTGSALAFSTFIGGSSFDYGIAIAVGPDGSAYLTGETNSTNFPTTPGSYDRTANGPAGSYDAFVTKLITSTALAISDVSIVEGNAGTTMAQFTVSLSDGGSQTVSVNYATADGTATAGSDYVSVSGMLTFAPGETSKTVTVLVNGDVLQEGPETFFVNLSSPSNALIADSQGVATIRDDDTTKFYVVNDATADRTYEYADPGNSIENYLLGSGNTAPRGAASNVAGDKLWVADVNKKVYVYNTSGGILGSWTAGTLQSTAQVEGLTTSGTDVWIVDNKSDKVFRYAAAASRTSGSQNAASSFSLNSDNANPKDIVTDGVHLWVVNDATTDKVFKYTLTGSLVGSWTISTSGAASPTGITLDPASPSHLWIVDSGTDRVYQYDAAVGNTSGSQAASISFALAAGNTNPQGIADPPVSGIELGSPSAVIDRGNMGSEKSNQPEFLTPIIAGPSEARLATFYSHDDQDHGDLLIAVPQERGPDQSSASDLAGLLAAGAQEEDAAYCQTHDRALLELVQESAGDSTVTLPRIRRGAKPIRG